MSKNIKKSIAIGLILGVMVALCQIDTSGVGLLIAIFLCLAAGPTTVYLISNRPNHYAILVVIFASLPLCAWYGLSRGLIYTLGISGLYGMISVQLFQALGVAYDNFKFIGEKLKFRK